MFIMRNINININEISLSIRFNDHDYDIILNEQHVQILMFIILIIVIIILWNALIPLLEAKKSKHQSYQRSLSKEASFDYNCRVIGTSDSIDDNENKIKLNSATPGFTIKTNMNISPTECNGDDTENIMEVCSVHSNVSYESNMGECDIKIDDNNHKSYKFVIDKDNVVEISNEYPEVLIGWRVHVQDYGFGVVLDVVKRKMRSTRYKIEFDIPICLKGSPHKKSTYELLLHRSEKKKGLPFTAVKKVA